MIVCLRKNLNGMNVGNVSKKYFNKILKKFEFAYVTCIFDVLNFGSVDNAIYCRGRKTCLC